MWRVVAVGISAVVALSLTPGATVGAFEHGETSSTSSSGCTPGENGCMPTPEQCATGNYNNFWDGGYTGRFAVCVSGGGHIVSYVGGEPGQLCGVAITNDVVVAQDEYGRDPNDCPKRPIDHNEAERTSNMKHFANVAPHAESTDQHAHSDLAFWGDRAFAGNYGGVRIFDISSPSRPKQLAELFCPARQNDVSVWDDILVVSVDRPLQSPRCGSGDPSSMTDPSAFEGLRIFSIKDILRTPPGPDGRVRVQPVATVPVDCGSHTNTLIPDVSNGRILVYVAATAYNPGPRCGHENALLYGYDPLHGKISIIEVPLARPQDARIVAEPKVQAPINGLEADEGIQMHRKSISCHDITMFIELKLAAASCISEAQLWDISDPAKPKTLEATHIDSRQVEFYHSAGFSWDGETVVFSDEPVQYDRCDSDSQRGRLWFYSVRDPSEPLGSFQIPRNEGEQVCYAHQFSVMPVPGRDILILGGYGGGVSVVDFTYPQNAQEIGFFDFDDSGVPSDTWTAYWYNGFIYAQDGLKWSAADAAPHRGFDIYHLMDPARDGARRFPYMNPQTQESFIR